MAWIICEGLDRTGKSTLAEHFKSNGYEVFHMSAPSKKYTESGYTGPSYLDECLDIYMNADGKDVFFDRSIYGELIWPQVYNRSPQLLDEDFDILKDYEIKNDTQYILMHDPDEQAHWNRCVKYKENLTRSQFILARKLFTNMASTNGFTQQSLSDTLLLNKEHSPKKQDESTPSDEDFNFKVEKVEEKRPIQEIKLMKANAINDILSSRIIKKRTGIFDDIEQEIRVFLEKKLAALFGDNLEDDFTREEVEILKMYVARLKAKMKEAR